MRRFGVMVGLILLSVSLIYLLRFQVLVALADYLIVDEQLEPADIIVVLNGEVETRPFYASELLRQGLAPRIVIPRAEASPTVEAGILPNTTSIAVDVMTNRGAEPDRITILNCGEGATSTRDEAQMLRTYVERHNIKRVIVVTSDLHTQRAGWIFEREFAGSGTAVQMAGSPHWGFEVYRWWENEMGLIALTNEYIRLAYYLVKY